jgi:multifunctional cyclase/dehydratase/O-methyltransferase
MRHTSHVLPAHVQLIGLVAGKWLSQPLYVLADLRVCDELAAGQLTTAELASRVGADSDILYRLMRAAAALGLLAEEDGRFRLLPLGEPLRSDVPCSVRDLTVFLGSRPTWESFAAILHTVRTGEPAFDAVPGQDFFSYLAGQFELAGLSRGLG